MMCDLAVTLRKKKSCGDIFVSLVKSFGPYGYVFCKAPFRKIT